MLGFTNARLYLFCITLSIVLYFSSTLIDLLLGSLYFRHGYNVCASLTIIFALLPTFITQVLSYLQEIWHNSNTTKTTKIIHLFFIQPFERWFRLLANFAQYTNCSSDKEHSKVFVEKFDFDTLHILNAYQKSATQITVQLFVIFQLTEKPHWLTVLSVSILLLFFINAHFSNNIKFDQPEDSFCHIKTCFATFLKIVWHLFMIVSRITAFLYFSLSFYLWIFIIIVSHLVFSTIWLDRQFKRCNNNKKSPLFCGTLTLLLIFDYFDWLGSSVTIFDISLYYSVVFIENVSMVIVAYIYQQPGCLWSYTAAAVFIISTFISGLLCLVFYSILLKKMINSKQQSTEFNDDNVSIEEGTQNNNLQPVTKSLVSTKDDGQLIKKPSQNLLLSRLSNSALFTTGHSFLRRSVSHFSAPAVDTIEFKTPSCLSKTQRSTPIRPVLFNNDSFIAPGSPYYQHYSIDNSVCFVDQSLKHFDSYTGDTSSDSSYDIYHQSSLDDSCSWSSGSDSNISILTGSVKNSLTSVSMSTPRHSPVKERCCSESDSPNIGTNPFKDHVLRLWMQKYLSEPIINRDEGIELVNECETSLHLTGSSLIIDKFVSDLPCELPSHIDFTNISDLSGSTNSPFDSLIGSANNTSNENDFCNTKESINDNKDFIDKYII